MPKPTLIGWAARAGIVPQWTTAHKIASGTHKTARRVVANIELISSHAMTAAIARRLARFWSREQKSNAAGRGATPSKGGRFVASGGVRSQGDQTLRRSRVTREGMHSNRAVDG
jgi:hypothetical protein